MPVEIISNHSQIMKQQDQHRGHVDGTQALKKILCIPVSNEALSPSHTPFSTSNDSTSKAKPGKKAAKPLRNNSTPSKSEDNTRKVSPDSIPKPPKSKPPISSVAKSKKTSKVPSKSPASATPSNSSPPSSSFFASSAFQNSPDPYSIPLPDFDMDDDDDSFPLPPAVESSTVSPHSEHISTGKAIYQEGNGNSKTLLLRNVLKVKGS